MFCSFLTQRLNTVLHIETVLGKPLFKKYSKDMHRAVLIFNITMHLIEFLKWTIGKQVPKLHVELNFHVSRQTLLITNDNNTFNGKFQ